MDIPRKLVLLLAAVAALVFAVAASGHGRDDHGGLGEALLRASLAPSVPSDPAVDGVEPGGVPWVLDRGSSVRLQANGELDLRVRGLVIPGQGSPGPVKSVSASLLCGSTVVTTSAVPLSSDGDARLEARIDLPATCLAPAVVVNPNGNAAAYIAVSGWKS